MPDAARPPRFLTRRNLLRGAGVGLVGFFGWQAIDVLAGANFHVVIPGAVYRSSQPSAERLEEIIKKYGIRTVVNFRGVDESARWYLDQCRVTSRYGVSEEDINGSSASRLPSIYHVRELVEILDRSEYPVLFHCNRGIDRTGMASAIALMLKANASLAEARKQIGPRYGHLPLGKTANIDRFFDLYEEWLARGNGPHSAAVFRRWLTQEYCPGPYWATIVALDPPRLPARRPCGFRVRCTNASVKPWRLRPGSNAGVHAVFFLDDDTGKFIVQGRSGLFNAVVAPGDRIDLTLAVPALEPGNYTLRVDMTDEQHGEFLQVGSEPLIVALEVR
jgi:hypothetical protein